LLDEPFAQLDVFLAEKLAKNIFEKILKNKTVIFFTNSSKFLSYSNEVIHI
jgi:ABC-type nitrate/sulfonate/bicarbonate transport system ATPase subunit